MPSVDVRPLHMGDAVVEEKTYPYFAYVLVHPRGLVLVDTGMLDSHPEIDDVYSPTIVPLTDQDVDLEQVVLVINTHLHFDHCGGNRLFPGTPIYVQRREREGARGPDYTISEWVEFEGANYVELDGEAEILPGIRVLPTPGHTDGHQSVLVDTDQGLVVIGGDVAHHLHELEAEQRLLELKPVCIWITHSAEPWEP
jgi:N-acyl homoserine lactone hydrolase